MASILSDRLNTSNRYNAQSHKTKSVSKKPNEDSQGRFNTATSAVLTGVYELLRKKETVRELTDQDRLDDKICLVTGGNSGLGFGIATQLAKRGAEVIITCRRPYPDKVKQLKKLSKSDRISLRLLELTDLESIDQFVKGLEHDGITLDVSIHNAGVTPPKARKTKYGIDEMFMVNYLSKFYLINELLKSGVIPNNTYASNESKTEIPRVTIISSDSHQGASAILIDKLGVFEPYKKANRGVSLYSYNKLILNTFAVELSRRLSPNGRVNVSVNPMCPGPVNSNIARDAPGFINGILKLIFKLFFKDPQKAALPVVYMAAAKEMENTTRKYLHMNRPKKMDEKCYDEETGKALWAKSEKLIAEITKPKQLSPID